MTSLHSDDYTLFISLLIEARNEAAMTQQQLADSLRKPQSFVSKYERCERRLDVLEFFAIAEALKTDPTALAARIIKALKEVQA